MCCTWDLNLRNITLEENKDYVIGVDRIPGSKPRVFIAEYEVDSRFKSNDPDSIVIKNELLKMLSMQISKVSKYIKETATFGLLASLVLLQGCVK